MTAAVQVNMDLKGLVLSSSVRKKINAELSTICTSNGNYYDAIPLQEIFDILKNTGDILVIQEDGTAWDGILAGADAHASFDIVKKDDAGVYRLISNCNLQLSWYRMGSGRYEITTYVF